MNIDYNWEAYLRKMEPAIAALKVTIRQKTGHEPTSEECWAYLAWCGDILTQHVFASVPSDEYQTITELFRWVSEHCSNNYRASITGKFDPPNTNRYETPEAFETAKTELAKLYGFSRNETADTPAMAGHQVIEDHHRGYL